MISIEVVVPYLGLCQKWSAAKVELTGDPIVLNRNLFISFSGNFNLNNSDIFFLTLTYIGGFTNQ